MQPNKQKCIKIHENALKHAEIHCNTIKHMKLSSFERWASPESAENPK